MPIIPFVAGEVLDTVKLNQIVSDLNAAKATADTTRATLLNTTLEEVTNLWSGQLYLDGSSNYTLWNSSLHKTWDYVRIYVSYDPQTVTGTNGHSFEINCGPNYVYGGDANAYSTLCTTYSDVYRRICVTTVGLNVAPGGNGAGWYLTRVVGVIKKKVT
jgi:hypothetical protein